MTTTAVRHKTANQHGFCGIFHVQIQSHTTKYYLAVEWQKVTGVERVGPVLLQQITAQTTADMDFWQNGRSRTALRFTNGKTNWPVLKARNLCLAYTPPCKINVEDGVVVVAFSLLVRIFGRVFNHSFPGCAFFFFEVEISSCTLIPLFKPGSVHSGTASWDDCGKMFPDKFRVSSIPDRFPHYAWTPAQSAHSNFIGSRVYACLGVTCHLHFWQNDQGLSHATVITQG